MGLERRGKAGHGKATVALGRRVNMFTAKLQKGDVLPMTPDEMVWLRQAIMELPSDDMMNEIDEMTKAVILEGKSDGKDD